MDYLTRDILLTLEKLNRNIGLNVKIDDFKQLTKDEIYFDIFQIMFPLQILTNMREHTAHYKVSERIQILIEILSQEILKMDLSHIIGKHLSMIH